LVPRRPVLSRLPVPHVAVWKQVPIPAQTWAQQCTPALSRASPQHARALLKRRHSVALSPLGQRCHVVKDISDTVFGEFPIQKCGTHIFHHVGATRPGPETERGTAKNSMGPLVLYLATREEYLLQPTGGVRKKVTPSLGLELFCVPSEQAACSDLLAARPCLPRGLPRGLSRAPVAHQSQITTPSRQERLLFDGSRGGVCSALLDAYKIAIKALYILCWLSFVVQAYALGRSLLSILFSLHLNFVKKLRPLPV
jgi:hypothetical protein